MNLPLFSKKNIFNYFSLIDKTLHLTRGEKDWKMDDIDTSSQYSWNPFSKPNIDDMLNNSHFTQNLNQHITDEPEVIHGKLHSETNLPEISVAHINSDVDSREQKYPKPVVTGQQKWVISIAVGLLAGIIFSPIFSKMISGISEKFRGPSLHDGDGSNVIGLVINVIIFIIFFRLLLG